MAKISKPTTGIQEASDTFSGATGIGFKVSKEFRHEFRVAAAQHDLNMTQLLHECFIAWKVKVICLESEKV